VHEHGNGTGIDKLSLGPLIRLAKSKDMRVQRNATGALLNMTHSGKRFVVVGCHLVFMLGKQPFFQMYQSKSLTRMGHIEQCTVQCGRMYNQSCDT
jgi:hypothetical protein